MYRLVLWYLSRLSPPRSASALVGILPYDPTEIAFSTAVVVAVCWISNLLFSRVFNVPANRESVYITALILALILDPVSFADAKGIGALAFASVWAMASKFILAIGRKHLFNPAAVGVALSALAARSSGDLVGRRQPAAAADRSDRRRPDRAQAAALRSGRDIRLVALATVLATTPTHPPRAWRSTRRCFRRRCSSSPSSC